MDTLALVEENNQKAEAFIKENLATMAKELLTWQDTGMLHPGKVWELSNMMTHLPKDQSKQVVSLMVKRAALKEIVRQQAIFDNGGMNPDDEFGR